MVVNAPSQLYSSDNHSPDYSRIVRGIFVRGMVSFSFPCHQVLYFPSPGVPSSERFSSLKVVVNVCSWSYTSATSLPLGGNVPLYS